MSENIEHVSHQIEVLERELAPLYALRAGRAEFRGNALHRAWCKECGKNPVDPRNGETTCPCCLNNQ